MSHWQCALCARTLGRLRNSALCKPCWQRLTDAGQRWCPRCKQPKPHYNDDGYCHVCRIEVQRERDADPDYRAHKARRARERRAQQRKEALVTEPPHRTNCAQCDAALSSDQRRSRCSCCSPSCSREWRFGQAKPCEQCGKPLPRTPPRSRFCNRDCQRAWKQNNSRLPDDAPWIPAAPQEPAQRATGDVLGTEGGYTYTANGAWVSRSGRGRVEPEWERLSNWHAQLPAYRRCHQATAHESIFDEVKATPSPWRHYPIREAE